MALQRHDQRPPGVKARNPEVSHGASAPQTVPTATPGCTWVVRLHADGGGPQPPNVRVKVPTCLFSFHRIVKGNELAT